MSRTIIWSITSRVQTVWHKVSRSWSYVKFVWRTGDFDWDYGFLEELIRMKLTWMRDYHASHQLIDSHNRVTKQLSYALFLLNEIDRLDRVAYFYKVQKREELVDRLFRHVRLYYRGWWE